MKFFLNIKEESMIFFTIMFWSVLYMFDIIHPSNITPCILFVVYDQNVSSKEKKK